MATKQFLKRSGVSFLLKLLGAAAAFTMTLLVGRQLSQEQAGVFFQCLGIAAALSAVARVGLDQAVIRYVSVAAAFEDSEAIGRLYKQSMATTAIVGIALCLALQVIVPWIALGVFQQPIMIGTLRLFAFAVPLLAIGMLHSFFFQGLSSVVAFNTFRNFGVNSLFIVGFCLSSLFGVVANSSHDAATIFLLAATLVATLATATWSIKFRSSSSWHPRHAAMNIAELGPFLLLVLLHQLSQSTPQIVVGIYESSREVATYHAAFRLASLSSLLVIGVNSVAFPRIAVFYKEKKMAELKEFTQSTNQLLTLLCIPPFIALLVCPELLLGLFGKEYLTGTGVLRILTVGQMVNVATGAVGGLLEMTGNQGKALRIRTMSYLLMVVGLFSVAPFFGMLGASIVQSGALTLEMTWLSICAYKQLGFAPVGGALRIRPVAWRNRKFH